MHQRREQRLYRFGVFEVDAVARELRRQGRRLHLQEKPFELLLHFLEHPGEIVTRDAVRHRLWPDDTFLAFDDSVNTAVRKVREALGDEAGSARFVETVPRHGYRFLAPVAVSTGALEPPPDPVHASGVSSGQFRAGVGTRWLVSMCAIAGVALGGVGAAKYFGRPSIHSLQFQVTAPPGMRYAIAPQASLSPDGRRLAFLAGAPALGAAAIWLQDLESGASTRLPGTDNASVPEWSPDGRSLAFVSSAKLRVIDLESRQVRDVAPMDGSGGVAWGADGQILFAGPDGLHVVSRTRNEHHQVTAIDPTRGERRHVAPQFLPDGRRFLFLAISDDPAKSIVYLGSTTDSRRIAVLSTAFKAMFLPPGHLLFVRDRTLHLQPFDPLSGQLSGDATVVARNLETLVENGSASFSVSREGALVYSPARRDPVRRLEWFDRSGRRLGVAGEPTSIAHFSLAPDEHTVVLQRVDPALQAPNLWLTDLRGGVERRVDTHRGNMEGGVWSPDGARVVYARHRGIHMISDLYILDRDSPAKGSLLLEADRASLHPDAWSSDGHYLAYQRSDQWGGSDLWILPMNPAGRPTPWLQTPANERHAAISPDGRWIAYDSNESGQVEVYVGAFDGTVPPRQISTAGGAVPRWTTDGREVVYVSPDSLITSVSAYPKTHRIGFGPPRTVLDLSHLVPTPFTEMSYGMSGDGRRFLVSTVIDEPGEVPITVVLNAAAMRASR